MYHLSTIFLLAFLAGCTFSEGKGDETEDWDAERLYLGARAWLDSGDYTKAIEGYNTLEARYPFGKHAQQSLMDLAYAHYKQEDADAAIVAADRFLKLYPQHPHIDYIYYLKGLVNFNRGKGITRRFLPVDESQRDPGASLQAFQDFAQLAKLFPKSAYAEDSRRRMIYLRNNLADYEVHVANYYMRRGAFVAAVNRARYVVENYPKTPAVPDALTLMAKAYKVLEIDDLSNDALRVLELNYLDHPGVYEVEDIYLQ